MSTPTSAMKGKVCVVTGATSGIGEVTARELAARGATVVVVGRSREKAEATAARIKGATGSQAVEIALADLFLQSEVRKLGGELLARHPRIDVLVNNAGAFFAKREETAEGFERTFALNHLSYFLLTHLLLGALKAAGEARIVNVSSGAHKGVSLDFDDLQGRKSFVGFRAYSRSKLANILFTTELARRLQGSGVTANCLHPGFVASGFGLNNKGIVAFVMSLGQVFALDNDAGAKTSIYLASAPEVAGVSGKYFVKCREATPSKQARDPAAAARLWALSEELCGIRGEA